MPRARTAKQEVEEEVKAKKATKGQAIAEYYKKHPEASRTEVALAVGCTVGRVGEVIRAGLTDGVGAKVPGSSKGELVLAWYAEHREGTRRECAEAVGCTVGRVFEVMAAHQGEFQRDPERKDVWAYAAPTAKPRRTRKAAAR